MSHITKEEQAVLDAFSQGKGVGYVDGMRASKPRHLSNDEIWAYAHIHKVKGDNVLAFAREIIKKASEK